MVEIRARHAEYSALRERIVEHIFIGEAMRRLWQLGVLNVEILHGEFDSSGYDLVMCCGRVMRHVQFKVSLVDGARAQVTINQRLAQAPSGCVVWLGVSEALEVMEYRWFGGDPAGHYRTSAIVRWGAIRAEMHKALKRNDRIREYSRKERSRFSAVWTRRSGGSLLSPDSNRKASRRARSPPRAVLWQRGWGCSHRSLLPSNVATKAPPGVSGGSRV